MSFTISIGAKAIDFTLPSTDGKNYSFKDFDTANSDFINDCRTVFNNIQLYQGK